MTEYCTNLSLFVPFAFSLAGKMWPMKTRFSTAGNPTMWKRLFLKRLQNGLYLSVPATILSMQHFFKPSFVLQGENAVHISSGWPPSPLLGVQVWVGHGWFRQHHPQFAAHSRYSTLLDMIFIHYGFWALIQWNSICSVGLQSPTIKPTTAPKTTRATKRPMRLPVPYQPAVHPPARYVKVTRFQNLYSSLRKGENLNIVKFIF